MMDQDAFLVQVAQHLAAAGISFMVAGSVVSSAYSQPRSTNEVDIVIDPTPAQLDIWLMLLGDQYYFEPETARDALRQRSMFNIIDLSSGFKADLIIRKQRPFSMEEFQRRKVGDLDGHPLPFASPEDIILTKLEWNKITSSERQLRDALNVAVAQWPMLDQAYLRKWAPQLGVLENLEEVLRAAKEAQPPLPS